MSTASTTRPTDSLAADQALRAVVAAGDRPAPAGALASSLTFAWRGLLKIKHVPEQLLDATLTPIMFTLMFTYLFGGALAGSPRDYLQFLLPGILVMTVLFTTVYSGMSLNTDVTKGVTDRFRSLPIWRPAPLVGPLLSDSARFLAAATVALTVGLILGYRPGGGVPGVLGGLAMILVFAFALSWVFTTLGLIMRSPNAVMNTGFMVLFPITFTSNIFVDPTTMPAWLESVVDANPITHLVTGVREMMEGGIATGNIAVALVTAAVLTAVFAPLTTYLYRRKS